MANEINIKLVVDGKEANATLSLTDSQLKDIARQAAKAGTDTTSSLSKIGMIVTGLNQGLELAKKGIDLLAKPVTLAMDAEQAQVSFEVLLGSAEAAKNMIASLKEDSAKTPYEFSDLQQVVKTLLNFGVAADQVRPIMMMLGDVAGGDAEKLQQLALVMGQVSSAGKLQGQDLLQLINAGFNPLQEISRTTGKSMADLRKEMESGQISYAMVEGAFKTATSEGGRFNDMMDKQSQTGKGLQSTLEDVGAQVLTSLGEKMLPTIKQVQTAAIEVASSMIPVKTKADEATESGQRLSQRFETLAFTVERLGSKVNRTKEEQQLYQEALDGLQKEYPNYFKGLDTHNSKYSDQVDAISKARVELGKYIDSLIQAAIAQDKMNEVIELGKQRYDATKQKLEAERLYNEHNAAGDLDSEDPKLKQDAALIGNRLLKVATFREILNAQASAANSKIEETTQKITSLRKELEGITKESAGIIPPTEDTSGKGTGKTTDTGTTKTKGSNALSKAQEDISLTAAKEIDSEKLKNMTLDELQKERLSRQDSYLKAASELAKTKGDEKLKIEYDLEKKGYDAVVSAIDSKEKELQKFEESRTQIIQKRKNDDEQEVYSEQIKNQSLGALENELLNQKKAVAQAEEGILNAKTDVELKHYDELASLAEKKIELINQEIAAQRQLADMKAQILAEVKVQMEQESFDKATQTATLSALEDSLFTQELDRQAVLGMIRESRTTEEANQFKDKLKQTDDQITLTKEEIAARKEAAKQDILAGAMQYDAKVALGKQMKELVRDRIKQILAEAVAEQLAKVIAMIPFPFNLIAAPAAGMAVQALLEAAIPQFEKGGFVSGGEKIVKVNEKGSEFIVNADATKRNLEILEAMNAGANLADMVSGSVAAEGLRNVSIPVIQPSGGAQGSAEGFKMLGDRMENSMKTLGDRLETVERSISIRELDEQYSKYKAKENYIGN